MGTQMVDSNMLAFIENEVMPLHEVINAIKIVKNEAIEKINPLIISHASSLSSLQMESSSVDFIISMGTSEDFPGDNLVGEFSRVLKPGGEIFIHQSFDAAKKNTTSSLGRKLLVAGFSNIEVVQMAEVLSEGLQSFGVKGKKPSWKILPKVEVVDEMDVIDEDSLLSEEDLKKSQLPTSGDFEVGSTPKISSILGDAFHQNIRLISSNTPLSKNVSRLDYSQPPRSIQFETICFPTNTACDPTKTLQNQSPTCQPQSTDDDDTSLPVKSSKRKSSEKTANPNRTGPAPAQTWSTAEEAALITAWIDISEEIGASGNYVGPFWNRILKHFYNAMGRYDYRTHHQLNSKWRDINRKVMKFNDIYNNLLNERGSGHSEADILRAALEQYRSEHNGVAFSYASAWDAFKKSRKWLTVYGNGKNHTNGLKRTKTSDLNDYTTSLVDFDEEDDPPVPVPVPEPEPSRPLKSSKRKSDKNIANNVGIGTSNGQAWTTVEEAALATAWVDISEEDGSTGNAQSVGPFWKRVLKHFHNAMGRDDYRTNHQLSSKWRDVNQKVAKFNDIYNNLLSQRGSDHSEADILRAALDEYRSEHNGTTFNHGSAWDVLKKSKKWVTTSVVDHTSGPKQTKTSDSNDYTTSSDACCLVDVNDEDDEIEPEDDEIEPEEPRRPIRRGKGNRASSSTLSGSGMDEKIDRLADKLEKFTSTYDQHLELEKEKIRIKVKAREEKIRAKNEAREVEDFKILTAKIDHLIGPSLQAALALKDKIAKRYGFE
ncbi:uncharacterized protein LOC111901134 isoform X1 [Lactuca sativa]|uniref:Myb-like domain-containing protein n=2 Tax=Lactuca sativa TaxID=4236 RepID=A0A9R1X5J4_LACSA|nr:uncharacterized protein LOC111901134 isoform X1 [Lactuca sativa]KAJ0201550.1 hypothetical protein LSAT_V11C600331420 [Lactuca sativa]